MRSQRSPRLAVRRCALVVGSAVLAGLLAGCGDSGRSPAVDYALVTVGDPGNAPDTTGFGAVAYPYRIGRHLVTIGQYAAFLNAVAATDTHGLYDPAMASDLNTAGISRSGAPGSHRYANNDQVRCWRRDHCVCERDVRYHSAAGLPLE